MSKVPREILDVHRGIVEVQRGIADVQKGTEEVEKGPFDVEKSPPHVGEGTAEVAQAVEDVWFTAPNLLDESAEGRASVSRRHPRPRADRAEGGPPSRLGASIPSRPPNGSSSRSASAARGETPPAVSLPPKDRGDVVLTAWPSRDLIVAGRQQLTPMPFT
jgi:hypothetical protein